MILKTVGIAFSVLLCSSHALATPQPMIEELFTASRTPGGQVVSYPEGTPEMRVYRITIPVGAKIPLHIHPSPVGQGTVVECEESCAFDCFGYS